MNAIKPAPGIKGPGLENPGTSIVIPECVKITNETDAKNFQEFVNNIIKTTNKVVLDKVSEQLAELRKIFGAE